VYQLVHRSNVPPKQIADRLGIGLSTLYNAANPDMEETQLCHKHIITGTNFTHNYSILDYFEHSCGRVAFEFPTVPSGSFSQVATEASKVTQRFGSLLEKVGQSLANDGRIDVDELASIQKLGSDLIAAISRLTAIAKNEAETSEL